MFKFEFYLLLQLSLRRKLCILIVFKWSCIQFVFLIPRFYFAFAHISSAHVQWMTSNSVIIITPPKFEHTSLWDY